MNFARSVVEGAGCLFKKVNLQHDFGHDATMVRVVDGQVRPREVAFQVKSGTSYVSPTICCLPATAAHIYFWAEHDLVTVGVVYDPDEKAAWWIDLQTAARDFHASNPKSGTTFTFAKGLWNRLDETDFASILVPTLLGEAPSVPLERLCSWGAFWPGDEDWARSSVSCDLVFTRMLLPRSWGLGRSPVGKIRYGEITRAVDVRDRLPVIGDDLDGCGIAAA